MTSPIISSVVFPALSEQDLPLISQQLSARFGFSLPTEIGTFLLHNNGLIYSRDDDEGYLNLNMQTAVGENIPLQGFFGVWLDADVA